MLPSASRAAHSVSTSIFHFVEDGGTRYNSFQNSTVAGIIPAFK